MSVSMDGVTITDYRAVVKGAHHDLTPLPDGKIATLVKTGAYTNAIHYYPLTTATR